MERTVPEDLSFLKVHEVRDLKDSRITTMNEDPPFLGAEETSTLSHIREIVKKLKKLWGDYYTYIEETAVKTFLMLLDTPDTYDNSGGMIPVVKYDQTGLDFPREITFSNMVFQPVDEPTIIESETLELYLKVSGETPNRLLTYCTKNHLNEEIIISTLII